MEKESLNNIIKNLEKKYGEGTIMKFTNKKTIDIETIPTGSISLDYALGIGGIPRGRIIEIFGPESSGKTTLALSIIAQAQKKGITCAFVDAEHSLDPDYSRNIGVDLSKMFISQPNSGEQALDVVEGFVKSREVGLVVVDSVAALTPQAEIDGVMGQSHIGLLARLMSQALRKLTAIAAQTKTTIIFVNQIRMAIGVKWGNPEVSTGGVALK
ncbi:MAG: ATPase domain-containing protein, partial [Methanogenium sp.]